MAEIMIFFSGQRLGASITIATLAFLYSIYAIIGSGSTAVMWGFVLLPGGIPVYTPPGHNLRIL